MFILSSSYLYINVSEVHCSLQMFLCCHLCSYKITKQYVNIKRHYANTLMQYTAIFHGCKKIFSDEKMLFFLIFAQNIDCGYTLEPPQ